MEMCEGNSGWLLVRMIVSILAFLVTISNCSMRASQKSEAITVYGTSIPLYRVIVNRVWRGRRSGREMGRRGGYTGRVGMHLV